MNATTPRAPMLGGVGRVGEPTTMAKVYDPTKDPIVIAYLLHLWHVGSAGEAYPPKMHHTKRRAMLLDGLVEHRENERGWKRDYLTMMGKETLLRGGHLPDPGQQWRFCRDVMDLASKIVALENGWRLSDRGIRVHLPHVWRCVEDFHRQADSSDYNRNETMRYFIHRAGDACEAYLTGEKGKAHRFVIEMREHLDKALAKGSVEGFTKGQRESWLRATQTWMLDENREDLPPNQPAQEKAS